MKQVRISADHVVLEVIPAAACTPNIAYWYGEAFAAQCIGAPDDVACGWGYDPDAQTFTAPTAETRDSPTAEDDWDAMLVDLNYRVTLLELGITE